MLIQFKSINEKKKLKKKKEKKRARSPAEM